MIQPLLADLNGLEVAGLICSMIFGGGAFIVALIALFRKSDTQISPQPLAVKIVEEMHEMFAGKVEFKEHVAQNTQRHAQLFAQIKQVDEKVGSELTGIKEKIATLQNETTNQSKQLEKLNGLEKEIREMPEKVIQNIVNAQHIGRIK